MNIAKVNERIVSMPIEWENENGEMETVNVRVKLNKVTMAVLTKLQSVRENIEAIAVVLAGIVDGWDLDFNGEEFPPTAENIANSVPDAFVLKIVERMHELRMGKSNSKK